MNISAEGNIYSFNADAVVAAYGAFVDGDANALIIALSSKQLSVQARKALAASAERLNFGNDRIAWVALSGWDDTLDPADLVQLIEGIDPIIVIATDGNSASILSAGYGKPLELDSKNRLACRTVAAFNNFEAMLDSPDKKQQAWHLLKLCRQ